MLFRSAANGQIQLEATDSTLFGMSLPEQATQSISEGLSKGMQDQFTGDLTIEDVTIIDGAVSIRISGDNVNFNDMNNQMSQTVDAVEDPR